MRSMIVACAAVLAAGSANAAVFVVDSFANSSTSGSGLPTIEVELGRMLTVTADADDLWSLGDLPRWTNADGLVARIATGTDESGEPAGTIIGEDFGLWSQDGFEAPFGSVVGEIGGVYKLLGLSFSGPAWGTGTLKLYNWDKFQPDNTGTISVNISAVPEPATWTMLITGFGLVGYGVRRRRTLATATAA